MKLSKLLTKVLFIWLFIELLYGQRLHLHKYRQEDSETKCTHGVVSGDTVVFKTEVKYTEDLTMAYLLIYIRSKTDTSTTTKAYNLQNDCNKIGTDCKHTHSHLVEITTRVIVTKEHSGARIYGKLYTNNSREIESEHHYFPLIYDPNPSTEQSGSTNPDVNNSGTTKSYLMIIVSNTLICGIFFALVLFAKSYTELYLSNKKVRLVLIA
ncbi:unnamed protein product [Lymnaea stagnalis]|uniref:Uncharacterized protein n=1 Tax=Lymnaea stagnalis TaxID=6523 RepID=A0AAV2H8Z2_LYMST